MKNKKYCMNCKYGKRKAHKEPCNSCIELREELSDPPMWTPKIKVDIKSNIAVLLVWLAIILNSWLVTTGLVWCTYLCFDLEFSWRVSNSIWLFACWLISLLAWNKNKK